MPTHVPAPTRIVAAGTSRRRSTEYVGRVNSQTTAVSIAPHAEPGGWKSRRRRPSSTSTRSCCAACCGFEHAAEPLDVHAGQAVIAHRGERVRYSSPAPDGAEYVAVCLPAFSPDTVRRDP